MTDLAPQKTTVTAKLIADGLVLTALDHLRAIQSRLEEKYEHLEIQIRIEQDDGRLAPGSDAFANSSSDLRALVANSQHATYAPIWSDASPREWERSIKDVIEDGILNGAW